MEKYRQLAKEVQRIYLEAGTSFNDFQKESKLTCLSGCGKCCLNPDISASMLEMLPLALELIDNQTALSTYDQIDSYGPICIFYQKNSQDGYLGECKAYLNRPSICRSFGASARLKKNGEKEWVICKLIKEHHKAILDKADINQSPIIGHFATMITTLDPALGSKQYPINEALKLILAKLLLISDYEKSD